MNNPIRIGLARYIEQVMSTAAIERESCKRYQVDYRQCGLRLYRHDRSCFSLFCGNCGRYSEHAANDMRAIK